MDHGSSVEPLWTVRDPATHLARTPNAVRCMLRRAQIPPAGVLRIGRRIRFRPAEVQAWLMPEKRR